MASIVVSLVLMGSPVCGLLATLTGMVDSFSEVAATEGPADAATFAKSIGSALWWTAGTVALFALGLVMFVVGIVRWVRCRGDLPPAPFPKQSNRAQP